ncbi:MAG: tetratricopeptide repeat protein [Planctomycetes bacterium]|nr:tetratricopeptide repeat protein [Planctomycetota bacterium]
MSDDEINRADRSDQADGPRRRGRLGLLLTVLALAAVAAAIGVWQYAARPHSAAQQLEAARKAEAEYLSRLPELAADAAAAERDEVAEAYARVFTAFEATAEEAATAHDQLARLHEHTGDAAKARQWWTQLIDRYGDTAQARAAYEPLIDSYVNDAKALLASDPAAAVKLLNEAAGTCEAFIGRYGAGDADAPAMAMRRCRIFDDLIVDPPIQAIEALEDFIAVYADSDLADEALWRLGRLHERIAEPRAAANYYERLIAEHPDSSWLKQAEIGRARTVSQFDPEAGEKLWRDLAAKYADDPEIEPQARREVDRLAAQREAEAQREQAEQARREAQDYRRQRYGGGGGGGGGGGPVDSGWGTPIPPAEMLRDFIVQKINAEHYRLDMAIDPVAHTLEMAGSVDLVNEGDEKRDFLLMLGPLMVLGDFALDGEAVEVVRPQGKDEVIHLRLSKPWPSGARATLTFAYTATVEPLNLPERLPEELLKEVFSMGPARRAAQAAIEPAGPRAMNPVRLWVAQEARDDGDALTPEAIAGMLASPALQFQLNDSGFALSGSVWYPVTIFGDLFTAEIDVTLPEDLTIVCSGGPAGDRAAGGRRTTTWRCEKPYFGLYFAYGAYESLSREIGGLTVSVHFFAGQRDRMEAYRDAVEGILAAYVDHFGPFPFEKLAMAQVKLPPILGGVGPASLMFLHHAAVAQREEVPVNLLAHELSHQWWGNQLPINLIDERYSQWLSEGFATYSDALYTEWSEGAEPFREHIRRIGKLYLEQTENVREDAIVQTFLGQSPLYRPVVYEKGALVLHALRYVLGDEVFFDALRHYVGTCAFTPSTVDDFRRIAAERSGRDLDWFFDEWLDRPGCPRIELADVTVAPGGGEGASTVTVSIVQPAHLSRMPIDVEVLGGGRARRVRVDLDRKEHTVTLDVESPVTGVVLDPDDWVLRRTAADEWPSAEQRW